MATFETTSRPKKIFKAKHTESGGFRLDYILLPLGFSYNQEYLKAKKGDQLKLFNGGTYTIFSVQKLKMRSAVTDILCRMRYGLTLKGALMRWQMNATLEGHAKSVISTDECLLVVFENGNL